MKVIAVSLVLFGALTVFGCGGDDDDKGSAANPVAACKSLYSTICKKAFNGCLTDAELALLVDTFGNNEADCNTKLGAECTEEGTRCDSGETYKPDQAQECLNQYESMSCNELKTGAEPAACELVCG